MNTAKKAVNELKAMKSRIEEVIHGKGNVVEQVLICLLAGGHILVEDLPGMGKTTLAYSLARALDGQFNRIQFTSDLLPADVLGVTIYNERTREFEFKQGPVFSNVLLADEINRSTPKTQSALLEVMDRGKVSIDGKTYDVGSPFMVFATQNPVDYEGTFPLPDSQMDRFLMRLEMGYPAFEDELAILKKGLRHYDRIEGNPVVCSERVLDWQKEVEGIFVEESVYNFLLRLVEATRKDPGFRTGISPRGALALKVAAQARAFYHGRDYVIPEDIKKLFDSVCGHRLRLAKGSSDPLEARRLVRDTLAGILEKTELEG